MRFEAAEIPALFADPLFARCSAAAVEAVFAGSVHPLAALLETSTPLRIAAFASSIQGLSCRLARLPDLALLPEALSDHILSEAGRTAARGDRILERLGHVLDVLDSAGVEVVALKGAALVLRGDVEPSLRPMGDLDLLLIDPSLTDIAAETLERRTSYRRALSTPRHLVLADEHERVPSPASEDPDNPLRIELHRSFRLPVLGVDLDATDELRHSGERSREGARVPSLTALRRHLWHHAAEDFAARGIRGIQAVDFFDMARRGGPIDAQLDPRDERAAAPLLYAADALDRLFPQTFDPPSLERLSGRVPPSLRERASRLPVLRHTRPPRGWSKTSLALAPGPVAKIRFLARTAFPSAGEVKANVAPGASGIRLVIEWIRVLAKRAAGLFR